MSFMPETSATDRRQTEIESEFVRVDEITAHIDKCVAELEDRLSRSILAQRKEAQGTGSAASTSEPVRVPLAQSLFEHGLKLEHVRERLSSMLSRIEA